MQLPSTHLPGSRCYVVGDAQAGMAEIGFVSRHSFASPLASPQRAKSEPHRRERDGTIDDVSTATLPACGKR